MAQRLVSAKLRMNAEDLRHLVSAFVLGLIADSVDYITVFY